MDLVNDTGLLVAWLPGKIRPPQNSVTLIVKGTFRLIPNGTLALEDKGDQAPLTGDEFYEDEPEKGCRYESDFAHFKPRADLLLTGTCHVPDGEARKSCHVTFGVNDWTKRLAVVGDRFWLNGPSGPQASEPRPFSSMPLSYEHSFGGSDYEHNPLGKGFAKYRNERGQTIWPLPNLEDPRRLLSSPTGPVALAGFGPLGRLWPQRRQNMGTYDDKWLKERWPWFPSDFDWGHFNAAPHDQQLEGYLAGDETLYFENLHPELSLYRSRLPGLRTRCFLQEIYKGQALFREVPMNLDTLWVDMDAERAVLVWRGIAEARSEELEELEHLMLVTEPVAEDPEAAETYRQSLRASLAAAPLTASAPEMPNLAAGEEPLSAEAESELKKGLDDELGKLDELLEEAGIEPALIKRIADPDQAEAAFEELLTSLEMDSVDIDALRAQSLENAKRTFAEAGQDTAFLDEYSAMMGDTGQDEGGGAAKESLDSLSRDGTAPGADLTGVDLAGRSFRGADLKNTILRDANLADADLSDADLSGAVLAGANLGGATLTGAKLSNADLTGATLPRADLSNSDLSGATFDAADLTGVNLQRVRAKSTIFTHAKLVDAILVEGDFEKADFSSSTLDRARFDGAALRRATFGKAAGDDLSMAGADLTELRAGGGCRFQRGQFNQARGEQSLWHGADLSGADFTAADLMLADFREANLAQSVFHTANIREGNLTKATLQEARFTSVNLFRARLDKANLSGADLSGSNCYEADFVDAVVEGAQFRQANLKMTKLAK